jgi:hypothetical protein
MSREVMPSRSAGGRSSLLRAGIAPPARPRNRVLRYGAILTLVGLLGTLVITVKGQLLPPDGPGWVLYLIHDTVWLPFYGCVWTAIFPDALIWLVIGGGLSALVLVEYLGIAAPLRRAQVGVLKVLLRRFSGPVLAMHRVLGVVGLRAELAEQVLRDLRDDALHAFTGPSPGPGDSAFRSLCHLQRLQVAFGLRFSRDLVAVVDVLGLAAVQPGARDDSVASLRGAAAALKPSSVPFWTDMMAQGTFVLDLPAALQATVELESADMSPPELACRTVRIAAGLDVGGNAAAMAWFDTWARLRVGADAARAGRLAEAEALCAFEFWAARAETALRRQTAPPLLAEAFSGLHMSRPRGETEAAGAVLLSGGVP